MTRETLSEVRRYFSIRGGDTVLEATPSGWIRWDRWDGPVATSIWKLDSPELVELTEDEAQRLIAKVR